MPLVSILAFFLAIFLLASISVTVAWMAFLKNTADDAAQRDLEVDDENSTLFRSQRLSSLNFWDSLLNRFDFVELLKDRIAQADLEWSVGRVTFGMLLSGAV